MLDDFQQAMFDYLLRVANGEALFRPSAAARWMYCHASIQMTAKAPKNRRSSDAAKEGTAAHFVGEQALKGGPTPEEWVGRNVDVGQGITWFITDEMAQFVQEGYLDEIEARTPVDAERYIEHKMSLQPLDPSDPLMGECRGTGDFVAVLRFLRALFIKDLKFGRGYMVAADAPQLKIYALMALLAFWDGVPWNTVSTMILQPRAMREDERIKEVVFDPAYLMGEFAGEVVEAMESALGPNPRFDPSENRCRWCDAKSICPALRQEALTISRDEFAILPITTIESTLMAIPPQVIMGTHEQPRPKPATADTVVLPAAIDLDPGEIATILNRRKLWDTWIEGVEHRAVQLMETGTVIPGWALKRRTGNRVFVGDQEEITKALMAIGVKPLDLFTEPKLRSPAQIEKTLPKDKKKLLEPLVTRPEGSVTLVPASDDDMPSMPPLVIGPIA